jgi:hypothetical protein
MFGSESPLLKYKEELDRIDALCDALTELNMQPELTPEEAERRHLLAVRLFTYNNALGVSLNWKTRRFGHAFKDEFYTFLEDIVFFVGLALMYCALGWLGYHAVMTIVQFAPDLNIFS